MHIKYGDGWVVVTLPCGTEVHAHPFPAQEEFAHSQGYPDATRMTLVHDPMHVALCEWLGIESESLKQGAKLPHDEVQAWHEEAVVLALERLLNYVKNKTDLSVSD